MALQQAVPPAQRVFTRRSDRSGSSAPSINSSHWRSSESITSTSGVTRNLRAGAAAVCTDLSSSLIDFVLLPNLGTATSPILTSSEACELNDKSDEFVVLQRESARYGAATPDTNAVQTARSLRLAFLGAGLPPTRLTLSADGGLALCFRYGNRYADIEVLNTGEVTALCSDGAGKIRGWEVNLSKLPDTVEKIREHVTA